MSAQDETKILDNKLLILYTLKEYFQKTKNYRIRRAELKRAADRHLAIKTDNERPQFGHGAFENATTWLEEEDAIIPTRDKSHKRTEYFLNTPKIHTLIQQRQYQLDLGKITPNPIEEEKLFLLLPKVIREIISKKLDHNIGLSGLLLGENSSLVDLSTAQHITRVAIADAVEKITPNIYNFRISSPDVNKFPINDTQVVGQLLEIVSKVASYSRETPFRLTLDYSGLPEHAPVWIEQIIKDVIPNMEFFCREILDYNFSEEDKRHLDAGRVGSLSNTGKKCFDIFWSNYFHPMLREVVS